MRAVRTVQLADGTTRREVIMYDEGIDPDAEAYDEEVLSLEFGGEPEGTPEDEPEPRAKPKWKTSRAKKDKLTEWGGHHPEFAGLCVVRLVPDENVIAFLLETEEQIVLTRAQWRDFAQSQEMEIVAYSRTATEFAEEIKAAYATLGIPEYKKFVEPIVCDSELYELPRVGDTKVEAYDTRMRKVSASDPSCRYTFELSRVKHPIRNRAHCWIAEVKDARTVRHKTENSTATHYDLNEDRIRVTSCEKEAVKFLTIAKDAAAILVQARTPHLERPTRKVFLRR